MVDWGDLYTNITATSFLSFKCNFNWFHQYKNINKILYIEASIHEHRVALCCTIILNKLCNKIINKYTCFCLIIHFNTFCSLIHTLTPNGFVSSACKRIQENVPLSSVHVKYKCKHHKIIFSESDAPNGFLVGVTSWTVCWLPPWKMTKGSVCSGSTTLWNNTVFMITISFP